MPLAAITGASGFIGRAVVERLIGQGWRVRALARSADSAAALERSGVEIVRGALADRTALDALVQGADGLVHCAGVVRGGRYEAFAAVNVTGTEHLAEAAAAAGVPVLALSSLAAREPQLSDYARSKAVMEQVLRRILPAGRWAAFRPPAVYGPGDRELRPLFEAMARGIALLPAPRAARVSLLYVDDLAAAVAVWLSDADKPAGVFEIHDGRQGGYAWDDVVVTAETLLGRRVRRLRLPGAGLGLAARANRRLSQALGYAPMLTPGKLRELQHPDWVCDDAPLAGALDWRPQIGLAEGLRRTCGWGTGPSIEQP